MKPWGRSILFLALLLPRAVPAQRLVSSPPAGGPGRPPMVSPMPAPGPAQVPALPNRSMPLASVAAPVPNAPTPTKPVAPQTFHDPAWKVSFDYPGDWTFTRKDGEISTFRLDARSVPRRSSLRAVAAIPENPFPASTFSGAYVYLSVTPRSTDATCARQATAPALPSGVSASPGAGASAAKPAPPAAVRPRPVHKSKPDVADFGGIPFTHGHDEQRAICITQRDEIYTTLHHGACYRFDLAINNFCGGEVSGVKDVTDAELEQVRVKMQAILATVRFDPK